MGIFRQFPYSNFHDMNMDEILKLMRELQEEWDATKNEWSDMKTFINTYFENLDVTKEISDKINSMIADGSFNSIIDPVIATETAKWLANHITVTEGTTVIDDTLTVRGAAADAKATGDAINDLKSEAAHISEVSLIKINDESLYNVNAEFEQGIFTSSGESPDEYWIRTPLNELLDNGFTIYNPDGLRWAIGVYDSSNTFLWYAILGSYPTSDPSIFTDKICHIDYLNDYKYRLRVARTTYVKLSPAQNTLKVYRDYVDKNDVVMKSRYRKPAITLTNALIYHKVGSASGTEGAIYDTEYYRVSNLIRIKKGETIRAYGAGAPTVWLMAEFNSAGQFIQGLKVGDGLYHIYEYTADHDMYIKICGQVTYYATGQNPVITSANLRNDTIIYYENDFYSDEIKNSPLYGKTITGMGDSLMRGSITGNDATWLHLLALKYNMTEHNLGINGNAFTADTGTGTPMSERYNMIPESDIIVVEGGANDKNSDVPLGNVTDTENTSFAGALNTVITGIRTMYPKATLLFLTDYNRYPSHYRAYADMMIKVCNYRSVPVFDNVSDANVALTESSMSAWQDEGLALMGTANLHLSPECYRKELLPKYEAKLLSLLGV